MKFLVIDIDGLNKIELLNREFHLEEVVKNKQTNTIYKKKYFKDSNYYLEYIQLDGDIRNLDIGILNKRRAIDRLVLICNKLDDDKMVKIKELNIEGVSYVIFCCKISLSEIYVRDTNRVKNMIVVPQLFTNTISINANFILNIILLVKYMSSEVRGKCIKSKLPMMMGYGKGEYATGEIVMKILENFEYIQKCSDFYLTLFSKEELNISELSYIEDPLREYMPEYNNIVIDQTINTDLENFICFCMSVMD